MGAPRLFRKSGSRCAGSAAPMAPAAMVVMGAAVTVVMVVMMPVVVVASSDRVTDDPGGHGPRGGGSRIDGLDGAAIGIVGRRAGNRDRREGEDGGVAEDGRYRDHGGGWFSGNRAWWMPHLVPALPWGFQAPGRQWVGGSDPYPPRRRWDGFRVGQLPGRGWGKCKMPCAGCGWHRTCRRRVLILLVA